MVTLLLDGAVQTLIPITTFRQTHHLPDTFTIAHFEPKDTTALGTVDMAGQALNQLKHNMLTCLPDSINVMNLQSEYEQLKEAFRTELVAINDIIGLDEAQIDFAVNGFGDVLQRDAFALLHHHLTKSTDERPNFANIYSDWLNESVHISPTTYTYTPDDEMWTLHTIHMIYGRVGLRITMPDDVVYVADMTHACPADGYMGQLLIQLAQQVRKRLA